LVYSLQFLIFSIRVGYLNHADLFPLIAVDLLAFFFQQLDPFLFFVFPELWC
jgi:hypothetical protein